MTPKINIRLFPGLLLSICVPNALVMVVAKCIGVCGVQLIFNILGLLEKILRRVDTIIYDIVCQRRIFDVDKTSLLQRSADLLRYPVSPSAVVVKRIYIDNWNQI
jgi:hypothetical protein